MHNRSFCQMGLHDAQGPCNSLVAQALYFKTEKINKIKIKNIQKSNENKTKKTWSWGGTH